jgi:hypothetical protein
MQTPPKGEGLEWGIATGPSFAETPHPLPLP